MTGAIRGIGRIIRCTVGGLSNGEMGGSMSESTRKIRSTATESFLGELLESDC